MVLNAANANDQRDDQSFQWTTGFDSTCMNGRTREPSIVSVEKAIFFCHVIFSNISILSSNK